MSRVAPRLLLLAVIVVAAAGAAYLSTRSSPLEVVVHEVDRGRVESTVANTRAGTIRACQRAKLSPQTGGQVKRLSVVRGQRVEKGELLLELWNEDLRAEIALALSQVEAFRAKAEDVCLAAELAEREANRLSTLFKQGIVGESTHDRSDAERAQTGAACTASRAIVTEAKERVKVASAMLARTILRAPFSGIVAEINAELGEVVTPSPPGIPTPPAIDLIAENCLYIVAPIDEVDAPLIRLQMSARVSLDAFPGRAFDGKVSRIAPFVFDREKQSRTVDVEVLLDAAAEAPTLVPGYSADVEILLAAKDGVLRVPSEAVLDGSRVYVLEGGRLLERELEIGLTNWNFSEVLQGLSDGELVVTSLDRAGVIHGAHAVADETQQLR